MRARPTGLPLCTDTSGSGPVHRPAPTSFSSHTSTAYPVRPGSSPRSWSSGSSATSPDRSSAITCSGANVRTQPGGAGRASSSQTFTPRPTSRDLASRRRPRARRRGTDRPASSRCWSARARLGLRTGAPPSGRGRRRTRGVGRARVLGARCQPCARAWAAGGGRTIGRSASRRASRRADCRRDAALPAQLEPAAQERDRAGVDPTIRRLPPFPRWTTSVPESGSKSLARGRVPRRCGARSASRRR